MGLPVAIAAVSLVGFMALSICFANCRQRNNDRNEATLSSERQRQRRSMRKDLIESKLVVHEWLNDDATDQESNVANGSSKQNADSEVLSANMERLQRLSMLRGADELSPPASSLSYGEADCAICLKNFEKGERVCEASNIQCVHLFHEICMSSWLLKHSRCPICRAPYLKETAA